MRKLRTAIGWITSIIPPFFGMWAWYLWWAEQDSWDYLGKLIDWMQQQRRCPDEGAICFLQAAWYTPWGKMILWRDGAVSLHDSGCIMSNFAGGVLGKRRVEKLSALCVEAAMALNDDEQS